MTALPQLQRRRIEAEILAEAYAELCMDMPAHKALGIIERTCARAARGAGQSFAASAPEGPSLRHFSGVVDIWRTGGALDIVHERLDGAAFSLTVTRCGYAALYLDDMDLAPELAFALSCIRDAAFAEGYSPKLRLVRSPTIIQGAPACEFRYEWLS